MTIPALEGQGLSLVGARGTGKSTVGRLLAERLGRRFVDADALFVAREGRSIPEFFRERGEPEFRDREQEALFSLEGATDLVFATGGGIVLREANRKRLRDLGRVVWLSADPDVLVERLSRDEGLHDRPSLTGAGTLAEVRQVLEARLPLYRGVADVIVETGGLDVERVADAVLDALARLPT